MKKLNLNFMDLKEGEKRKVITVYLNVGGHVLIMCKLSCIINDDHIFPSFGIYLHGQSSRHLYMPTWQNLGKSHV